MDVTPSECAFLVARANAFDLLALSGAVARRGIKTARSLRMPVRPPEESTSTSGVLRSIPNIEIAREFTDDMCPHTRWATAGCFGQEASRSFAVMTLPSLQPLSFQPAPMTHSPSGIFFEA